MREKKAVAAPPPHIDFPEPVVQAREGGGSEFAELHGMAGLAGTIIDDGQLSLFAPLLAEHLGLRVEN